MRAYHTFKHTGSTAKLKFTSKLDDGTTDESFGIREIVLEMQTVDNPQTTLCGRSSEYPLPDRWCACKSNEYMSPPNSGNCLPCASTCYTCNNNPNTCTSCDPNTNRYLNGNTCSECDSACALCFGGARTQCTKCKAGFYLVGNTCYQDCNPPFTSENVGGILYCKSPCTTPGSYVYWDGTCNTCPSPPLEQTTYNSLNLCKYKCTDSQFLYWNTTCLASCPSPLKDKVANGKKFCEFPCADTDFL